MAAAVDLKLDKRFKHRVKGVLERYSFDIGVLQNTAHRLPGKGLKSMAGGLARKTSKKTSGQTISDVSALARKNTGINFYTRPFRLKKNREILRFTQNFFKFVLRKSHKQQLINTLQAVVRNPILRGDYGRNKAVTAKIKGFNRLFIDTGQLFKAIKARVNRRGK